MRSAKDRGRIGAVAGAEAGAERAPAMKDLVQFQTFRSPAVSHGEQVREELAAPATAVSAMERA